MSDRLGPQIDLVLFNLEGITLVNSEVKTIISEDEPQMYSHDSISGVKTKIDNFNFHTCDFININGFDKIEFGQRVDFVNCNFIDVSAETHSVFRNLKSNFIKNNNEFLTNYFAGLELKSKFHSSKFIDDPIEYILNFIYLSVNDFGLSRYRPILILLGFSLAVLVGLNSFHDTIVFAAGPFRILTKDFDYLNVCSSINKFGLSALSGLLWLFIILGIRKRFKIDG